MQKNPLRLLEAEEQASGVTREQQKRQGRGRSYLLFLTGLQDCKRLWVRRHLQYVQE